MFSALRAHHVPFYSSRFVRFCVAQMLLLMLSSFFSFSLYTSVLFFIISEFALRCAFGRFYCFLSFGLNSRVFMRHNVRGKVSLLVTVVLLGSPIIGASSTNGCEFWGVLCLCSNACNYPYVIWLGRARQQCLKAQM